MKLQIVNQLTIALNQKLDALNAMAAQHQNALRNEAKSTAGDKHETGRAMIHLEQEKLAKQLISAKTHVQLISALDINKLYTIVETGALVKTNKGLFFVAISFGKIQVIDETVFVLSPTAPLSQSMLHKAEGDSFTVNGARHIILNIQ